MRDETWDGNKTTTSSSSSSLLFCLEILHICAVSTKRLYVFIRILVMTAHNKTHHANITSVFVLRSEKLFERSKSIEEYSVLFPEYRRQEEQTAIWQHIRKLINVQDVFWSNTQKQIDVIELTTDKPHFGRPKTFRLVNFGYLRIEFYFLQNSNLISIRMWNAIRGFVVVVCFTIRVWTICSNLTTKRKKNHISSEMYVAVVGRHGYYT